MIPPPDTPPTPLFPRLSPNQMAPEAVAANQRARLEAAMVEAVGRKGFAGTTLRDIVGLAGVSRSTFYKHFDNKRDCFLASLDEIVARSAARAKAAYRQPGDPRAREVAALAAFMDWVVEEPAAASLAIVESLTLGRVGVAHVERASAAFERLVRQSLEQIPGGGEVSPMTVRAVVAGIRGVVYRRLRKGRREELPGLVEPLVDWAFSFQRPDVDFVTRAMAAAAAPAPDSACGGDDGAPDWTEPPANERSRTELSQRERIVRAAAQVAVDRGYEALTIPAISAAAGTSNQTFYENFGSKREAFLAAFETLAAQGLADASAAFDADAGRPEAIGRGIRAVLEYMATNEIAAHLAFFELPAAGPVATDRAEAAMDGFTALLDPAILPGEVAHPVPRVVREATASGIWSAVQHELAQGRLASLPKKAPEITRLALLPLA
jgi:AcrR family transcriptional regulator